MNSMFRGGARPAWLVPVAVVVALLLVVIVPLVAAYNGLVDRETDVERAFADLDVQLQRRADLIPNLAEAVQAALDQEQEVFGEIARARQNYAGADDAGERLAAGAELERGLGRLLVIVEQYPELRSNENIRDLQIQLEGTENRVAQARRDYNEVVAEFNRSIRRFPRSLVAGMFGFDREPLFETEPADRDVPELDLDARDR